MSGLKIRIDDVSSSVFESTCGGVVEAIMYEVSENSAQWIAKQQCDSSS
jgi:hypothetical protein